MKTGKHSIYSITERRVPELIPVLGSQPAGDVSHKPGGRLPLVSASTIAHYSTDVRRIDDTLVVECERMRSKMQTRSVNEGLNAGL